ncbi:MULTISPECIES: hypothetical protein [Brevibacillus]|uniref:Uncharacterized protein n=1 Tax=Brevibacillus porteri TaxID=2126350 RepID=A0ABX5FVG6_9BACL|nr:MULTISPECIES: hypothetical protein [Brevibacillus]MDC0759330.1 hypothetical protein [Brevibacillus sp. AG]MED1798810.1 hypothetical protein [Brevibacillus porteri]MED2131493.1 hypothetical protein [Brevibacillus porteri]MED2744046.1 hypothetical protein [Brevibacillus porteri]MED2813260.1 hypothetical protein [Brevibacillus porteri]
MKSWPNTFLQPEVLKQRMLVLSALDILMCQEEWLRRYQFDPQWDENTTFASINNGAGDDLYILFTPEGVIVKGFDHESEMSPHAREEYEVWPGIYEQVPPALLHRLDDEALTKEDVTFCLWRESTDHVWKTGDVHNPQGLDDGSDFLLGMIYDIPEDYVEWAEAYYEVKVPFDVVGYTFSNTAITEEMITELNPEVDLELAIKELQAIGFTVT